VGDRAVLVAYVLAMAFTLVYSGEHYVFDVIVGWFYAVAVFAGVPALERLLARLRAATAAARQPALAGAPVESSGASTLSGRE
jgi:membrane-associated phospholipid phosphatase